MHLRCIPHTLNLSISYLLESFPDATRFAVVMNQFIGGHHSQQRRAALNKICPSLVASMKVSQTRWNSKLNSVIQVCPYWNQILELVRNEFFAVQEAVISQADKDRRKRLIDTDAKKAKRNLLKYLGKVKLFLETPRHRLQYALVAEVGADISPNFTKEFNLLAIFLCEKMD